MTNKYFGQRIVQCFCFSPDSASPLNNYLWVDHLVDSTDPSLEQRPTLSADCLEPLMSPGFNAMC